MRLLSKRPACLAHMAGKSKAQQGASFRHRNPLCTCSSKSSLHVYEHEYIQTYIYMYMNMYMYMYIHTKKMIMFVYALVCLLVHHVHIFCY